MGGSSHCALFSLLFALVLVLVLPALFDRFLVEARLFWNQALTVLTSLRFGGQRAIRRP